jgi:hypothetical protein
MLWDEFNSGIATLDGAIWAFGGERQVSAPTKKARNSRWPDTLFKKIAVQKNCKENCHCYGYKFRRVSRVEAAALPQTI